MGATTTGIKIAKKRTIPVSDTIITKILPTFVTNLISPEPRVTIVVITQ
jgi:hypothetical protein